jgi:hypothetical protein
MLEENHPMVIPRQKNHSIGLRLRVPLDLILRTLLKAEKRLR